MLSFTRRSGYEITALSGYGGPAEDAQRAHAHQQARSFERPYIATGDPDAPGVLWFVACPHGAEAVLRLTEDQAAAITDIDAFCWAWADRVCEGFYADCCNVFRRGPKRREDA